MTRRTSLLLLPAALIALALGAWHWLKPRKPDAATVAAAYMPLPPVNGPLRVYHLGHSLVGRTMPAMLAQLAPEGNRYESQLGWGTSLKEHWDPDLPINGFDTENAHDRFRPAKEAIQSGAYDAVVLTEMVELRDAIRYHDSGGYLHKWAELARAASPETQVYLYETWHRLDDDAGWLDRLDRDLSELWEDQVIGPDLMRAGPDRPVRVIPAGQVMAAFVRAVESRDGVAGLAGREDLFARDENGELDPIHINDLGAYLVALTHYAVLYRRSPVGLPHALTRADGSPAQAPGAEAARLMQETVWSVVTAYPRTGVAP